MIHAQRLCALGACVALAVGGLFVFAANVAAVEPVPPAAEVDVALQTLRTSLKGLKRGNDGTLATSLLDSVDPKQPAAERYGLMREAMDLALRAGDAEQAIRAIGLLADGFAIAQPVERVSLCTNLARTVRTPYAMVMTTQFALWTSEQAIAVDD